MPAMGEFWAVVPAGGAGTRLWPLSRGSNPKFLLDLTGSGRTLLQATVDRLAPLVADRVLVVTGTSHAAAVRRQLPGLSAAHVLAEPAPRDSMAAIGLGAAILEHEHPEAVLGSFAADQVIADEAAWRTCVTEAVAVAEDGLLVTIGIEPRGPSTGFGYIRGGERLADFDTAVRVQEFVEKPDADRAAAYVASRSYRWNAGMFVVRASVLLDLLDEEHPELAVGLRRIASDPALLDSVWPALEKIAIDHAVAEPAAAAGRVAMVPGSFGWDDIGDFDSLARLLPCSGGTPMRVLGDAGLVLAEDATGLVVPAGGRTIVLLGVDDVVVVDTGDALLVSTLEKAQRVKEVVARLNQDGRDDLT